MLEQSIGHLFQSQAHIFQADFLGDYQGRHSGKLPVHTAHQSCEHGAIAHTGIEQADCGRSRSDVLEFLRGAAGDC